MKIWKWTERCDLFNIDVPVYRFPYLAYLCREMRYRAYRMRIALESMIR